MFLTKLRPLTAAALALTATFAAGSASALSFDITTPNQQDFRSVAEDLTAALDYKALGGAEPGGVLGFYIGTYGSYTSTQSSDAWSRLTGKSVDGLGTVGLRASKGLPFGFDVGGFYSRVPGSDASVYGGELRYAILDGSVATPALAVRGTYTRASNTGDFDYSSYGTDLSISKGILFLTPYAGIGYVHSDTKAASSFALDKESFGQAKYFVGTSFSLLLISATLEYERLGDNNVYSLKGGITF